MKLQNPQLMIFVEDQFKNGYSLSLYKKNKEVFGVSSYRPEHVFKMDKEAVEDFAPKAIEFRSFSDLSKGFDKESVKAVKLRQKDENKVFRFKSGIWTKTDGKKIPDGKEFNGARLFKFLKDFEKIQYKRYIPDRDVIFKSAKKKLYFYKNQKDIDFTMTVGQAYPCGLKSKSSNCILVATNKVQGYYGVALKKEVKNLFNFKFLQKKELVEKSDKQDQESEKAK